MADELIFLHKPPCRAAGSPAGCWRKQAFTYKHRINDLRRY